MSTTVVRKSISFEQEDILTVENLSLRKGLGSRGFSAALRMIIREWIKFQRDDDHEKEDQ